MVLGKIKKHFGNISNSTCAEAPSRKEFLALLYGRTNATL